MNNQEILSIFAEKDALLEGHFVLSSGLHSNQYMQCALVLQYPLLAAQLCSELAKYFKDESIDVVAGPALGGITIAYELGRQLGVRAIFGERKEGDMLLRRGFSIRKGDRVLLAEDVITTGKSVRELEQLIKSNGGILAGFAMLVDRSKGTFNPGCKMASLIELDFQTYMPDSCPLCNQGIPAVKPGSRIKQS